VLALAEPPLYVIDVFEAFWSLDECDVRARFDVATGPLNGRLKAFDGRCIGTCDDNQILPSRVDRSQASR
jgi:hypothetical protein